MADDKVMEMVRAELQQNPAVRNDELLAKAKKLDKGVGKLSIRQFHARYPLQVKRQLAAQRPRRRSRKKASVDRNAIKAVLLQFAKAVMDAEGKAEVVDVVGGGDRYVEKVLAVSNPVVFTSDVAEG